MSPVIDRGPPNAGSCPLPESGCITDWTDKFLNCSIEERRRICHTPEKSAENGRNLGDSTEISERIDCKMLRNHEYNESSASFIVVT